MCEFCKIIEKKRPAHIVYENGAVIAFLDIDPIHEGHILIVPKEHAASIDKLSEKATLEIMKIARKIVVAFREIYGIDGYSIMQNGGEFCDFGHVHFHIFPRFKNDGFGWKYPNEKAECSAEIAKKIRKRLGNITFLNEEEVDEKDFNIAVIVAKCNGKIVLCKHKERDTWEIPGGHREKGETILDAAKRELYEETGAKSFMIKPVCAYKITQYAMLYYAEIETFEKMPDSEIECIDFFEELPNNITYPSIHPDLYDKAMEEINNCIGEKICSIDGCLEKNKQ